MANNISLGDYHPLSDDLKPIKVGGDTSTLEIAKWGGKARINGDLEVVGDIPVITSNRVECELFQSKQDMTLDSSESNIILDSGADIELNADGGDITLKDDTATIINFSNTELKSELPLKIKESANAVSDDAAYGQLWVKNTTPNELYFTNDAGTDIGLTSSKFTNLFQQTTALNQTQMNDLHNTAVELIPAKGAEMVIVPIHAVLFVDRDASTTQSVSSANLNIGVDDADTSGTNIWFQFRRFMWNEGGDRLLQSALIVGEFGQSLTGYDNKALKTKLSAAITSGSVDSCAISITYYVFNNE